MHIPVLTSAARSTATAAVIGVAVIALAACGGRDNKDKSASQTAAKVNKEEITVHQINYFLGQQPVPPAEAASAAQAVLERLIDQELVLQKAAQMKLDREPRVVQQVDAARRDVIVRAYVDKIGQGAPKPSAQEVLAYYDAHPALFRDRRIYNIQEVNIEATAQQVETLKGVLARAKSFAEFVGYLKDNGFKYGGAESVRSAEQLPLADVDRYAAMKDGQATVSARPGGMQVVSLIASRSQPIAQQQATPVIEQFLLNERRRKLVGDDLAALRTAAKIDYVGQFKAEADANPYRVPVQPDSTPVTTLPATLPASAVNAAPQVDVNRPATAGSMPSDMLDRGLKGLK